MKHTTNKPSTTHSIRLLLALLAITSVSATADTNATKIDPSKLSTNISDTDPVDYQKKKNYNSSFLRFGGERGSTTASSTSIANEPSARNITMLYCDSAIMLPNPLGMPKHTKKFTDQKLSIIPAVSSLPMKRDSTVRSMIAESKIMDNISMRTIAVPHHHGYVNGNCLGNYSIVQMTHTYSRSDMIVDEEEEVSYNFEFHF